MQFYSIHTTTGFFRSKIKKITESWFLACLVVPLTAATLVLAILPRPVAVTRHEAETALRHVVSMGKNQVTAVLKENIDKDLPTLFKILHPLTSTMIFENNGLKNQIIIFKEKGTILSMPLAPQLEGTNIFRLHDKDEVTLYHALALDAISDKKDALRSIALRNQHGLGTMFTIGFAVHIPELNAIIAAITRTDSLPETPWTQHSLILLSVITVFATGALALRLLLAPVSSGDAADLPAYAEAPFPAPEETTETPDADTSVQHIINQLPLGVAFFDVQGRLETANHDWTRIWEHILPKDTAFFNIHGSPIMADESMATVVARAFAGKDCITHTHRYSIADGKDLWMQFVFQPISIRGKLAAICMMQTDITAQMDSHRCEQELRWRLEENKTELMQALNHIQNLIDASPSIIFGVDKDNIVRTWNTGAEKYYALPRNMAVGQPLISLSPSFSRYVPLITRAIKEKIVLRTDKAPATRQDINRYESVTIFPYSARDNEEAFLIIDDVTSRARQEEQHLQKAKLSSISSFAAGLAHEINNPLGVILHGAQNLRRRLMDILPANLQAAQENDLSLEALSGYVQSRNIPLILDQVKDAGRRSAGIIASLVRFSTGAKSSLSPQDIGPLISRCVHIAFSDAKITLEAHTGHITVDYLLPQDLPRVLCSPEDLEHAFSQILSNAFKAVITHSQADGDPRVTVSYSEQADYLQITIRDNGRGMDEEVQKHIFDPFFTTPEFINEGVGLGLPLAHFIIVTIHQGTLTVASTPGAGAAFTIRLRRAWPDWPEETDKASIPSGFAVSPSPLADGEQGRST